MSISNDKLDPATKYLNALKLLKNNAEDTALPAPKDTETSDFEHFELNAKFKNLLSGKKTEKKFEQATVIAFFSSIFAGLKNFFSPNWNIKSVHISKKVAEKIPPFLLDGQDKILIFRNLGNVVLYFTDIFGDPEIIDGGHYLPDLISWNETHNDKTADIFVVKNEQLTELWTNIAKPPKDVFCTVCINFGEDYPPLAPMPEDPDAYALKTRYETHYFFGKNGEAAGFRVVQVNFIVPPEKPTSPETRSIKILKQKFSPSLLLKNSTPIPSPVDDLQIQPLFNEPTNKITELAKSNIRKGMPKPKNRLKMFFKHMLRK